MRPLAGLTAWLVTDGKAGHEAQAAGLAEALGVVPVWQRVAPEGLAQWLAPWGPADRSFACAPPYPAIAIAIGRTAMPALRLIKKRAGLATFRVALQDPRTSASIADVIWVPEHDRRRGANIVTTLVPPNRFTPAFLDALRGTPDAVLDRLPGPRVMLAVGGASKVWRWTEDDAHRLASGIRALGEQGASFMATPSRRTPGFVADALAAALAPFPHSIWSGEGENPYARYLALADAVVVTADSVSMTGEGCATGRPVYVFRPSGGSDKFVRFHERLHAAGATRPLTPDTRLDTTWRPPAIHAAGDIAREIEGRFESRARVLGLTRCRG
ncbi:MAG: mitochondrial fission ELM1 family protein [Hyphomicrobiaceae bacterium]